MTARVQPESLGGRRLNADATQRMIHVVQGEHAITADPGVVMVTILGSCVAACLRDPRAGLGGMNHFLMPGDIDAGGSGDAERQAVHAMELLVNALLAAGASRTRLEAKVFGGGSTMTGLADVGSRNADFAVKFLDRENIEIVGQCLGGRSGRRVQYWPVSGRARRSFVDYELAPQPRKVCPKPPGRRFARAVLDHTTTSLGERDHGTHRRIRRIGEKA